MDTQAPQLDQAFEEFVNVFAPVFSKPQMAHFRVYLMGLVLYIGVHWLSRLHTHLRHDKDYTSFVRFVSEAPWSRAEGEQTWQMYLNRRARRALSSLKRQAKGQAVSVYLIIDDTLNPKRGKRMEWVGKYRAGKHQPVQTGHCMVSALLVIGNLAVPVAYSLYKKKVDCQAQNEPFFSKIELACAIIDRFEPFPETKTYVLADSWYSANDLFKFVVNHKQFEVLTALKNNRTLYHHHTKTKAQLYAQQVADEASKAVTIAGRHYHLHRLEAKLSSGTTGIVVVSRCWIGTKWTTFFLFCSDRSLTTKQIVELYRIRWEIETFYKNAKQLLGLAEYQFLREEAILRHWLFVFLAYTFLEVQRWNRYEQLLAQDPHASKPTLGDIKQEYGQLAHRLFIKVIFDFFQQGLQLDTIYSRLSL